MGIPATAQNHDEFFQVYEKLADYLTEPRNANVPFEQAVFQYFQTFSPSQKLNVSQIPFNDIRIFLQKFFAQKFSGNNAEKSTVKLESAADDEIAASKLKISSFQYNYFFGVFNELNDLDYGSNVKVDRRTAVYKRSRRTNNTMHEYVVIDCNELSLPVRFREILEEIYRYGKSSVECFELIVNSLAVFYANNTWSTNIQECVANFVGEHVIRGGGEICAEIADPDAAADDDDDPAGELPFDSPHFNAQDNWTLLKMEVMCLLDLFCAKIRNLSLDQLQIVNTLKVIRYVYGDERLSSFVNGPLFQKFGDVQRNKLEAICAELGVPIATPRRRLSGSAVPHGDEKTRICSPKKKERRKRRISSSDSGATPSRFSAAAPRMPGAIDVDDDDEEDASLPMEDDDENDEEYSSGASASNDAILRERIFAGATDFRGASMTQAAGVSSSRAAAVVEDASSSAATPTTTTRKVSSFTPAVPIYHRRIDSSSDEDVKATSKSTQKSRKKENVKLGVVRVPMKRETLKTISQKRRASTATAAVVVSRAKSTVTRPSPEATKKRISIPTNPPTTAVNAKKTEKSIKLAPIFVQRSNTNGNSSNSPVIEPSKNASSILDDNTVGQYKKKMEAIRHNGRSLKNSQEIFYGRSHSRKGLFDDEEEAPSKLTRAASQQLQQRKSTTTPSTGQKSRSGRAINAPPLDRIYVAHTLLNVRNAQPLTPFRATQVGEAAAEWTNAGASDGANAMASFRLRKFVKPANRTERRRIEKFKKMASVQAAATTTTPQKSPSASAGINSDDDTCDDNTNEFAAQCNDEDNNTEDIVAI